MEENKESWAVGARRHTDTYITYGGIVRKETTAHALGLVTLTPSLSPALTSEARMREWSEIRS